MIKGLLFLFAFLLPCSLLQAAENYSFSCVLESKERKIEVVYLQEGRRTPCEVRYIKDGVSQLLWNARREEGFCELKADAFIEKQEDWGWSCRRSAEQADTPESATDG